jgi:ABC-type antimicrobial peptide transport system permease subunit
VIGVVQNTQSSFFNTLEWLTKPILYLPAQQAFDVIRDPTIRYFPLYLHIRTERPLSLQSAKAAVGSLASRVAIAQVSTTSGLVAEATQQPKFRTAMLSWFGIASLLLAGIGVYGLVAQAVAQRTREIGVRIALGAGTSDVIRSMTRPVLVTGVTGALCGCAAALALSAALQGLLYGVRTNDALAFIWAVSTLLAVTAVAALIPARRAARTSPLEALRTD